MIVLITDQLKILKKELKRQEKALGRLKRGCLVQKTIKGKPYYYLVSREGAKVRTLYIGKVSVRLQKQYDKVKLRRKQLRADIGTIKKEMNYYKRLLGILQRASKQRLKVSLLNPPILRLNP